MKKLIAIILSALMLLSLCACTAAPAETTVAAVEEKTFSVLIVHADKSEKTFTCKTSDKILGDILEEEGVIISEGADDGMFHTVDGETADWNENGSYWAFYVGEEYATTGIYDTEITDGAQYRLEYTIG